MKLVRYGEAGREKPGLIDSDGRIRDLSAHVPDIAGAVLDPAAIAGLSAIVVDTLPLVAEGTGLGPCVAGVGKFICIGLNFSDHAAESGMEMPPEPVVFMKATSAIAGPQ